MITSIELQLLKTLEKEKLMELKYDCAYVIVEMFVNYLQMLCACSLNELGIVVVDAIKKKKKKKEWHK